MARFSLRHGFDAGGTAVEPRHEASHELRGVVVDIFYECCAGPPDLAYVVRKTLRLRAPEHTWNDHEIRQLIDRCQWFEVYDLIEAMHRALCERDARYRSSYAPRFQREVNDYFVRRSIGWFLADGILEARASRSFERAFDNAKATLNERGFSAARRELAESMRDLSRRPTPDLTGSVQHAAAALECVARELTGDRNLTLGQILARHRSLVPAPLNTAVEKLWGFVSERGRHMREDREELSAQDAELVIHVIAALVAYLAGLPPAADVETGTPAV